MRLLISIAFGVVLLITTALPTQAERAGMKCNGIPATITGTDASENITGTSGYDVIWAGAGADLVLAKQHDDVVCGNSGYDSIFGQAGADFIFSGKGKDLIVAGSGPDEVYDGPGADVIRGQGGGDLLYGAGTSADHVFGGGDNDVIYTRDRAHIRDRVNAGAGLDDLCITNPEDIANNCESDRSGASWKKKDLQSMND